MSEKEKKVNKKIVEYAKKEIEEIVGMSYDKFEKLDIEEQRKLLKKKTGKKYKYDTRLHIDGVPVEAEHNFCLDEVNKCFDKFKYESKNILKKILKK